MLVLVSYDVSTIDAAGPRRLHRIAKACLSFGQRVQHSVFECVVDPEQWARLRFRLLEEYDPAERQPAVLLSREQLATPGGAPRSKTLCRPRRTVGGVRLGDARTASEHDFPGRFAKLESCWICSA